MLGQLNCACTKAHIEKTASNACIDAQILSLSTTIPDVALPADERTMVSTTVSRGVVNITHTSTEPSFSTAVKFPDLNDSSEKCGRDVHIKFFMQHLLYI